MFYMFGFKVWLYMFIIISNLFIEVKMKIYVIKIFKEIFCLCILGFGILR